MTQITENYILNGEGSRKETRHIVFALGDSGMDYKVGDALGVVSENPPHIVEEILEVLHPCTIFAFYCENTK